MPTIIHLPTEGNSLIARGPDGSLINLRAAADGTLLTLDPVNSSDYNADFEYIYDAQGRLIGENRIIDGQSINYTYWYDPVSGDLKSQVSDLYPRIEDVLSVAGRTGVVVLDRTDVNLGNVDNVRQEQYVPGGQEGEYLDGGGGLGSRQWKRLNSDNVAEGANNLYFTVERKAELMALMGASAPVAVWYTAIFNNLSTPSTDGSRVLFPLSNAPGSAGHVDVSKNGETLILGVDYTIVGTNLTFTVAPQTGDTIFVRYGASMPVGTIAANAVTVEDAAGHFSASDQEGVNAQIGRILQRMITAFDTLDITIDNS